MIEKNKTPIKSFRYRDDSRHNYIESYDSYNVDVLLFIGDSSDGGYELEINFDQTGFQHVSITNTIVEELDQDDSGVFEYMYFVIDGSLYTLDNIISQAEYVVTEIVEESVKEAEDWNEHIRIESNPRNFI